MKRVGRIIKTDRTALFDDDEFDDENCNLIKNNNQDAVLGSNTFFFKIIIFIYFSFTRVSELPLNVGVLYIEFNFTVKSNKLVPGFSYKHSTLII